MSDDCDGFPPSESNTTVLAVSAASTSAATNLAAATAIDTTTVPHAKLATSGSRVGVAHKLIFSSSQAGRLMLGGSSIGSTGATGGQAIAANFPVEIDVEPGKTYFRFYNASADTTANTAWTNPSLP